MTRGARLQVHVAWGDGVPLTARSRGSQSHSLCACSHWPPMDSGGDEAELGGGGAAGEPTAGGGSGGAGGGRVGERTADEGGGSNPAVTVVSPATKAVAAPATKAAAAVQMNPSSSTYVVG